MRITIEIPDELEGKLRKLAEVKNQTPEEYARRLVIGAAEAASFPPDESAEEWIARFQAWVDSHKGREFPQTVDDSRESIYEGRGARPAPPATAPRPPSHVRIAHRTAPARRHRHRHRPADVL